MRTQLSSGVYLLLSATVMWLLVPRAFGHVTRARLGRSIAYLGAWPPWQQRQQKRSMPLITLSPTRRFRVFQRPPSVFASAGDAVKGQSHGLDENQRTAVEASMGVIRVVAGPGSGKTRVLTRRIAHLIKEGAKPWQILAVTFTNKAAGEMKERLEALLGPEHDGLTVGTFHSVCVKILRRFADELVEVPYGHGIDGRFTVCDTADGLRILREVINKGAPLENPAEADSKKAVKPVKEDAYLRVISSLKSRGVHPQSEDFEEEVQAVVGNSDSNRERLGPDEVISVYREYQRLLRERNMLDFDDLLLLTLELVKTVPSVRSRLQAKWHHVLVDEWQDTNVPQYELVRQIATPTTPDHTNWWSSRSLMVVGDMDQSIYGWRGADPRSLARLLDDYTDATTVMLDLNYRSTATIVNAAQIVISRSQGERVDKFMKAVGDRGQPINVVEVNDELAEGQYITRRVSELLESGVKSVGVIYRTNAQSRILEMSFIEAAIPHRVVGALAFFSRKEIKDAVAFLKIIANPSDVTSLRRIINVPPRKIGEGTAGLFFTWLQSLKGVNALEGLLCLLLEAKGGGERLQALHELITEVASLPVVVPESDDENDDDLSASTLPPTRPWVSMDTLRATHRSATEAFNTRQLNVLVGFAEVMAALILSSCSRSVPEILSYIVEDVGLREFVESVGKDEEKAKEKGRNLLELVRAAQSYKDAGPALAGSLMTFLEDAAIKGGDSDDETQTVSVNLMTAHASKGLEFDAVFVAGLEKGTFPLYDKDEERRLMFVAMTRARKHLHLTWRRRVAVFQQGRIAYDDATPSPFLNDLPVDLIECTRQWGTELLPSSPTSLADGSATSALAGDSYTRNRAAANRRKNNANLLPTYRDALMMKGTSLTYNHSRKRTIKERMRDEEAAIHTEVFTLGSSGLKIKGAGPQVQGKKKSVRAVDKEGVIEDLREKLRKLEEQGQRTSARLGARLEEQARSMPVPPTAPSLPADPALPPVALPPPPPSTNTVLSSLQPTAGPTRGRNAKITKSKAEAAARRQAALLSGLKPGLRVKHPTWGDGVILETGETGTGHFIRVDFVIGPVDLQGTDATLLQHIK